MDKKRMLFKIVCCIIVYFYLFSTSSCTPVLPEGVTLVLPRESPHVSSIVWSPIDPNKLLVTAISEWDNQTQIFILDSSTITKQWIVEDRMDRYFGNSWSWDGCCVLIAKSPSSLTEEGGVFIWDLSDVSQKDLVGPAGDAAWSPNGNLIAILTRPPTLHLIDTNTQQESTLSLENGDKYTFGLSWSVDGRFLVFSSGDFSKNDLYIFNIGSGQSTKISSFGNNYNPAWSPAGDLIVYNKHYYDPIENRDVNSLHLINSEGTCDIEIPHTESALSPTWLPDGHRLGYVLSGSIYVIDLDIIFGKDFYQTLCP